MKCKIYFKTVNKLKEEPKENKSLLLLPSSNKSVLIFWATGTSQALKKYFLFLLIFSKCLFVRGRACEAEREGQRIWSELCTVRTELDAGLELTNRARWLNHTDVPKKYFLFKVCHAVFQPFSFSIVVGQFLHNTYSLITTEYKIIQTISYTEYKSFQAQTHLKKTWLCFSKD